MQKYRDSDTKSLVLPLRPFQTRVFANRTNSSLTKNSCCFVCHDRRPINFVPERSFTSSFVIGRILVAGLNENIGIKTGGRSWIFRQCRSCLPPSVLLFGHLEINYRNLALTALARPSQCYFLTFTEGLARFDTIRSCSCHRSGQSFRCQHL